MAKIRNAHPKSNSGGYSRLFGDKELGDLITRIQSTVITSGTELEKMIFQLVKKDGRIIEDCKEFFQREITPDQVSIIPKKAIKAWEEIDFGKSEPDFIIIKNSKTLKHCYIIELKDGDMFDTKKARGEKETLRNFEDYIARHIQYTTSIYMCCFNNEDKEKIVTGFKNKITKKEAMTGKEFCDLLNIDYEEIITERKKDAKDNFSYFIESLMQIDTVKAKILELVKP